MFRISAGADEDPANLSDGHGLAVTADAILLDADGMPVASRDLIHNLRVTRQIAVLFSIVDHGHQLAAARAGTDMLDNQPHEARHFQADRPELQRGQTTLRLDDFLDVAKGGLLLLTPGLPAGRPPSLFALPL
jgi:hypothetical protein